MAGHCPPGRRANAFTSQAGSTHPTHVATTLSTRRQQIILAFLLAAFAGLAFASLLSATQPSAAQRPWDAPNACGPVGATLAFGLVWVLGRAAAYAVPV